MEWTVIVIVVGGLIFAAFSYLRKLPVSSTSPDDSNMKVGSLESSLTIEVRSPNVVRTISPTIYPVKTAERTVTPIQTFAFLKTGQPTSEIALLRGKIVFTCTPEKYNQLCLMNADGSNPVRLTDRKGNDYYPSFSTDGRSIVFVSNQTGQFEVYTLNLQRREEKQITGGVGNVAAPDISPDGRWIVFSSKIGGDSSIWLIPREGGRAQPLTDSHWNEVDPSWSPDGKQIAFASNRGGSVELFVMTIDTGDINRVPTDSSSLPLNQATRDVQGIGGRSSWSPDGAQLVFYAGPRGDRDIYVVDLITSLAKRLTFGGNNSGPCFSPDGNWIAFSSSRDGDHEIYIMRVDGSEVTQLTDNAYDDWQPTWGP